MFHRDGPTFFELAEQALSSVERGYDLLADKFDYTPFRTPDAILDRVFADLYSDGSVESAVDLCCGTGAALTRLRPLARTRVTGIDLSRAMLARARVATERARGTSHVELVHGDVLEPNPAWGSFELATCFGAFGHILEQDEPRFVRAVRTLLVPRGRFVFVTTDGPPPVTSSSYWLARGFNAAMRLRNAILRPPFVMYYLTFMLPRARALLESEGFTITVTRGLFAPPLDRYVRVVAKRE